MFCVFFFFFKQKTAYEMRISDWSSDVCSSDLGIHLQVHRIAVQQGVLGEVARVAQRRTLGQEFGARHREDGLVHEGRRGEARKALLTEADCHVDTVCLGLQVDHRRVGADAQVDLGVALVEAAEPRDQPLHGERWAGGHRQNAAVPLLAQLVDLVEEAPEGALCCGRQLLALVGEREATRAAVKQREAEAGLELLDLLADRALGDVQLGGRAREAEMAGGDLEGAQGRQRGRSEEHTSELQSLMRISYAVFCLKKKNTQKEIETYS